RSSNRSLSGSAFRPPWRAESMRIRDREEGEALPPASEEARPQGIPVFLEVLGEGGGDRQEQLEAGLGLLPLQLLEIVLSDLEHAHLGGGHRRDHPRALDEQRELAEG